jgi:hypothetical protein
MSETSIFSAPPAPGLSAPDAADLADFRRKERERTETRIGFLENKVKFLEDANAASADVISALTFRVVDLETAKTDLKNKDKSGDKAKPGDESAPEKTPVAPAPVKKLKTWI